MSLVKGARIVEVSPCIADPAKIRVVAQLDGEVGAALPYLHRLLPNSLYSERANALSYKRG